MTSYKATPEACVLVLVSVCLCGCYQHELANFAKIQQELLQSRSDSANLQGRLISIYENKTELFKRIVGLQDALIQETRYRSISDGKVQEYLGQIENLKREKEAQAKAEEIAKGELEKQRKRADDDYHKYRRMYEKLCFRLARSIAGRRLCENVEADELKKNPPPSQPPPSPAIPNQSTPVS